LYSLVREAAEKMKFEILNCSNGNSSRWKLATMLEKRLRIAELGSVD
jgi:hypothetical protein